MNKREDKTITTEFRNNGVFRYYIKTLGFCNITQDDTNLMYYVNSLGHQIKLKFSPKKTISFIDKNGFTVFESETCTKEKLQSFLKK